MELLEKYLIDKNLNGASSSLREYLKEYELIEFMYEFFKAAFEKKGDQSKHAAGQLSCTFIINGIVLKEEYLDELSKVVKSLKDYEVEMPAVWEHLAKILFHLCSMGILSLPEIAQSFAGAKASSGSAKFLKCLLNLLIQEKGKFWLGQKWIIWNISTWGGNISLINDFVKGDQLKTFVIQNNFQFLCNAKVLTVETAKIEIHRMFCANESFNTVRSWINENVGQERSLTEEFLGAINDVSRMTNRLISRNKNQPQPIPNSSTITQPGIVKRLSAQYSKQNQSKPPVIHMSLSLHQDVKLHEAEYAWKPARFMDQYNMTEEEIKTDVLYKRVRGVLNKLTPQKFNKLVEQVKALPIDNLPRLQGVIDLVFKKAVDEPSFSVAYAQMCKILRKMGVPSGDYTEDGTPILVNFRKLLIDKCQHEFEKNTAAELKRDERFKEINLETDPDKKKMLQLIYKDEERRIRMKSLGNVRFIGELYKLNMLTARIMHSCINNLINSGDEESLECLCKLLTTVGQGLEKSVNDDKKNAEAHFDDLRYSKQNFEEEDDRDGAIEEAKRIAARKQQEAQNNHAEFNNYFKRLEIVVKSKGTSSYKVSGRVRFIIQDLIDLRNNKWISRRDDSNPKTLDQIRMEVERKILDINTPLERKRQVDRNMLDNRKRGPDSAGWTTITSTPSRGKFVFEDSELKVNKDKVEIRLSGNSQFLWDQGAIAAKPDDKGPDSMSSNMFAALGKEISEPSSISSYNGTSSLSERYKISCYKLNVNEDEVGTSRRNRQHGPGSRTSSKKSASFMDRNDRRYTTTAVYKVANVPKEPLSPEQVKMKANLLLDKYLNEQDLNEATLSLKELFDESSLKDFVIEIIYEAFEKKGDAPKHAVGTLLSHFMKNNDISKEQYLEGLSGVLETLEDFEIDLPLVWEYLAEIIVHMCSAEILSLRDVALSLAQVKGTSGSAKFLKLLLKVLLKEKGNTWLEQKWIVSNIALEDIIKPELVENFVKENNLEFLFNSKVITMETIRNEIRGMITAKESFDYIKA